MLCHIKGVYINPNLNPYTVMYINVNVNLLQYIFNYILQKQQQKYHPAVKCSYLKCMLDIKPLQIDCHFLQPSCIFFTKRDQILNHIFNSITFYDTRTESKNHILQ